MMTRRLSLRCMLGLVGACLLLSSTAYADPFTPTMRLRLEDLTTGKGIVLTDNGIGDLAAEDGVVTFMGSVGNFGINFTAGVSKPVVGGVYNLSELDLNSLNIQTKGGPSTLRITLEDTGFSPLNGNFGLIGRVAGIINAGPGASATFQSWANAANLVPTLGADKYPASAIGPIGGVPAGSSAVWPGGITFGPGAFSNETANSFLASGVYSLFSQVTLSLTGPGSATFNELSIQVVPEPGTLLLLGSGLSAAAYAARRRHPKKDRPETPPTALA